MTNPGALDGARRPGRWGVALGLAIALGCVATTPGCGGGESPAGDAGMDAAADAGPTCADTLCGSACVDLESDPRHCGTCDHDCTALPGVDGDAITCVAGACVPTGACDPGRAHCTTDPDDGCETDITTPTDCGGCGVTCAEPTPLCSARPDGTASCASGCEGATPTRCGGTCVDATSDPTHCGDCDTVCPDPENGIAACSSGSCGVTCDPGFHACDLACASDTDVLTCGTACTPCATPDHAQPTCDGTACGFTCDAGFDDCDGDPANGCETELATSLDHCGACDTPCTSPLGTPVCAAGVCTVMCDGGRADCDGMVETGCEVDTLTDVSACGGCGNVCTLPNATAACTAGACAIATCDAGFADCNGMPEDGCETNTQADPGSCGGCGNVCTIANGAAACVGGMCAVGACSPGFDDCNGQVTDGCETNVGADVNSCGTCGNVCNLPNATEACMGGSCAVGSCDPGFSNCNNVPGDGCEVNTQTTPTSCGGCGVSCFVANGTAGCSGGFCTVASCNPGFADCNGVPGDGCETNTQTSATSCGTCGNACGTACSGNVLTTSCSSGSCQILGCAPGYYNIDGLCGGGCECRTTGTSASCLAPSALGTVNVGQTITFSGNLVPVGQEAYLTVTFAGNANYSYHPRVRMTAGSTEFAFDILTNCSGAAISCGVEGGSSVGRSDWEVAYTAGDPNDAANFNPIPPVGSSGTVIIHVYRRAGRPVTCNNYTLTISN